MLNWVWAAASCAGTSHIRAGTKKDDAFAIALPQDGTHRFGSVVCDGAGSAKYGRLGAYVTARIFSTNLRRYFLKSAGLPSEETLFEWLDEVRDTLGFIANSRNAMLRDFATTLVLSAVSKNRVCVGHIGDGGVVAQCNERGDWVPLSWPEHGEYASTTYFVTDSKTPRLRVVEDEIRVGTIVSFSDGIERLVLDFEKKEAPPPFFNSMATALNRSNSIGKDVELSEQLSTFVRSDRVTQRSDDDITIVIAQRTPSP
ncbi:MAG: PP2C family serine/threonine-protein phosphatase [Pseudomonadota bacterium]